MQAWPEDPSATVKNPTQMRRRHGGRAGLCGARAALVRRRVVCRRPAAQVRKEGKQHALVLA